MSPKLPARCDRWRFGPFEIDTSTGELRKNGLRIHIQEQPARILGALLERAGELVTREELRDRLWPAETFVDFERSLNAAVAKLRQVLADSAEQPRYVETVARHGYRFVAPVASVPPELEAAGLPSESIAGEAGVSRPQRTRKRWAWAAAALILVVLGTAGAYLVNRSLVVSSEPRVVRFAVTPPDGTRIHPVSAVSPDGRTVAYVAIDNSGQRALWVRTLASENALRLESTDGALAPFFSHDSQDIGFFAEGKLKRIPASGGAPRTLCEQSHAAGGTWNADGVILFSQEGRLYQVPAGGGIATELKRPDPAPGATVVDTWPQFLPDGQRFVVRSRTYTGHLDPDRSEILVGSLSSSERHFLLANRNQGVITASGHMFFVRRGALVAQRVDFSRYQLVGEPLAVAEDITMGNESIQVETSPGMLSAMGPAAFSVSNNGVLVYHSSLPLRNQLVWFDRQGKRLGVAGEALEYTQLFLSPDERWAAVGIRNRERKGVLDQTLWLMQLDTNVLSRLSFGGGQDADPVWSPDSQRIVYGAYNADEGEKIDLVEVTLGKRTPTSFYSDGKANKPEAWSPDGSILIYRRDETLVFTLPTLGDRKPVTLLDTRWVRGRFQFSPDGRWLAYASTESGQPEVYVSHFPAMSGTRQVSTGASSAPVWRKDGKELFYMTEDGRVMSVEVKAGSTLETGPPKMLFHPDVRIGGYNMGQYGVAANGQRFLVVESPRLPGGNTRMHVVSRWDVPRSP